MKKIDKVDFDNILHKLDMCISKSKKNEYFSIRMMLEDTFAEMIKEDKQFEFFDKKDEDVDNFWN